jgi:hypothetical protein
MFEIQLQGKGTDGNRDQDREVALTLGLERTNLGILYRWTCIKNIVQTLVMFEMQLQGTGVGARVGVGMGVGTGKSHLHRGLYTDRRALRT